MSTEVYKLDVDVSFFNDKFNHLIRKQQFNELDILSYIGGLLGLFAGFSVLSFIEVVYWFTIRNIMKNFTNSSSKVVPLNEQNPRQNYLFQIGQYLVNYFNESSIHGLEMISKSNLLERYLKL